MSKLDTLKKELMTLEAERAEKIKNVSGYDKTINEGGEGYSHKDVIDEEYGEKIFALSQKIRSLEFEAEWTIEVFEERKAAYNAAVLSKKYKLPHQVDAAVGFTKHDLLRAKAMLGA